MLYLFCVFIISSVVCFCKIFSIEGEFCQVILNFNTGTMKKVKIDKCLSNVDDDGDDDDDGDNDDDEEEEKVGRKEVC